MADSFNPMTDIGIYTYKNVFVQVTEHSIQIQDQKTLFRNDNMLATYPPGVHQIDVGTNLSNIKYFETFSKLELDVPTIDIDGTEEEQNEENYKPKTVHDESKLQNKRIYRDKCYYDPIVTFVDIDNNYYTFNYSSNLKSDLVIKLIIVQISHIPFETTLIQKYNLNLKEDAAFYRKFVNYSYNGTLSKNDGNLKYIDTWQILAKSLENFQTPLEVEVNYYENTSSSTLHFFSSVFSLPAYLMEDKGFTISVYQLVGYDVEKVKVTANAQLPFF